MQKTLADQNKKDTFYKTLFVLALPLVIQNLIDSCCGMADTIMLGYVSQSALSATALAGNIQFIINMFIYGFCSGSSVLIAQYWGRKDTDTIERTVALTLRLTLIVGLIFFAAAVSIPKVLMTIYTNDTDLIELGSSYLRIIGICYLTGSFTQIYISSQRAVERVMFGTVVNMISLLMNVALNACFIFGLWFFPKAGIIGVAYATVIARVTACVICIVDAAQGHQNIYIRLKYFFHTKKQLMKDFLKYTLPALGEDFSWGLGFSMYSVILGHLGTDIVAANSYATVCRSMSTVICFAIANASAVIMGKTLGENDLERGHIYGRRFMNLSIVFGVIGGITILAFSPLVLNYVAKTDLSATAQEFLRFMLYVSSLNVVGQSVNTMLMAGVFRAGGDTKYGFICDTCVMWIYGVSVGCLLAFVFKLPPMIVYLYLFMDETLKMPINFWRYTKKKWVRNITRNMAEFD